MTLENLFGGILIALLIMVLIGGLKINRRLQAFQARRDNLVDLVDALTLAIDRANAVLADLKATSDVAEAAAAEHLQELQKLAESMPVNRDEGSRHVLEQLDSGARAQKIATLEDIRKRAARLAAA